MSFVKEPSKIKRTILAFIKHLVDPKIYNAIAEILNPCCSFTITDIEFECTDTDEATITVTLQEGISFPGTATATISSRENEGWVTETYTPGSKTIVFEGVTVDSGATDVNYTVRLAFITSTESTKGVFVSSSFVVDNPTCP